MNSKNSFDEYEHLLKTPPPMSLDTLITRTCYGDLKNTLTAPIVHYMDLRDEERGFTFSTEKLEDQELVRTRVLLFRQMAKSIIGEDGDWAELQREPTYMDMERLLESLRHFYGTRLNWVHEKVKEGTKSEEEEVDAECDFMWLEYDLMRRLEEEGQETVFD
jgi:hypothetical protein